MAENRIIAASLKVDSDDAVKNVLRLKGEVAALQKEFNGAQAGSDAQLKALKKLKAAQDELGTASKALGGNFKNIKDQLTTMPGATSQLTGSLGGLNQAFNILKANPIIGVFALLAGLVIALFDKFKKMEGVSDSLGKAWGTLSGLFSTFLNKILTPLIDAFVFFVDLFTSAATFIADIFSPGLAEAAKRSGELAEALDDLNDAEAQSAITRAESNLKLQEARELAEDANVPIRERIKALQDAGKIEKEEFDKSVELARRRAQIMLEQLAIESGARAEVIQQIQKGSLAELEAARNSLFAQANVDKSKFEAIDALIIKAKDQGAERARVSKKTEQQISSLEREEESKRKEERNKANADAKAAREKAEAQRRAEQQKLVEFNSKLRQLQQDNDLALIKDGYQKELAALQLKLYNDKKANEQAVKDRKLTKEQALQLDFELDRQANFKKEELAEKHNKEVTEKEADFQSKISKLRQDILLSGIVDAHKLEQEQLKIGYEQSLAQAQKEYGDNAEKLAEFKALIDEKYKIDRQKLDDKEAKEKAQKDLEDSKQKLAETLSNDQLTFDAKRAAVDAEIALNQKLFDEKLITEVEYNKTKKELQAANIQLDKEEAEAKKLTISAVSGALGNLATLAGKQTVLGKALAIAQTTIDTYQSAISAYKSLSGIPVVGPALGAIAAAAAVKNGIDAVKRITSVQVPGSGGGGASAASAPALLSPPAPLAPTQQSTRIIPSDEGNAAAGGVDRTIRAYVMSGDIQSETERDARLSRQARLGG